MFIKKVSKRNIKIGELYLTCRFVRLYKNGVDIVRIMSTQKVRHNTVKHKNDSLIRMNKCSYLVAKASAINSAMGYKQVQFFIKKIQNQTKMTELYP